MAEAERARVEQVKAVQDYERLKVQGKEARRKQIDGEPLTIWDRSLLRQWDEVRAKLGL